METSQVLNIGDITEGGFDGQVTAMVCVDASIGNVTIAGIFDTAGGVPVTNLTHYIGTGFLANTFTINNAAAGGRVNDIISWQIGSLSPKVYVGSFQNNTNATFNNVDGTLPEAIAYSDQLTNLVRTDFIFDIAAPGFDVTQLTSVERLNDTIFIGGNFGDDVTDVAFWVGSSGNRHRGIAVLDINQSQPTNGIVVGRLLPLNGDMDINPPTGEGVDGTQPLTVQNGVPNITEIVRDMAVVNGELHVVGTLDIYGLIDADGLVDPARGIIPPSTTICGGFIWTPDPNNARFGTARPLEIDITTFDLIGEQCRVIAVNAVPDGAPNVLDYSHIYQLAYDNLNPPQFETGGVTTFELCSEDLSDLSFQLFIEGPGQLRTITVNDSIVFDREGNPVVIGNTETFQANFEVTPATFSTSFGGAITGQNFRQAKLQNPTTIVLRFEVNTTTVDTRAYITYKPAYISSELLICDECV